MKYIDVRRITSDPTERVRFVEEFVGFTDRDRAALSESLAVINAVLPRILDDIYAHLLSYDDTRRIFLGGHDEIDPAYMALRKEHLTLWLLMVISSDGPKPFATYVSKMAAQHTGGGEHPDREVPPRYVVMLTSYIQTAFLTAILDALPDDPARARRLALAWNKLLMVQLELFLKMIVPSWPEWDAAFVTARARVTSP